MSFKNVEKTKTRKKTFRERPINELSNWWSSMWSWIEFPSCSYFILTIASVQAVHSAEYQTYVWIRSHLWTRLAAFSSTATFSNFWWKSSKFPKKSLLEVDAFLAQRRMLNYDESEPERVLSRSHTRREEQNWGLTRREKEASIFSFHGDGSVSEISNRHTEGAFM